jgi:hypothetical protein
MSEYYIYGSGARRDGRGSAYAKLNVNIGRYIMKIGGGLTTDEAECFALLLVLRTAPRGSRLLIHSASQLMVEQFNGNYEVYDHDLLVLLERARTLIEERGFAEVILDWVPRERNLAGTLLEIEQRTLVYRKLVER